MTTDQIDALLKKDGPRWLLVDTTSHIEIEGEVAVRTPLLPGSFNPLHHGHQQLARVASSFLAQEVHYELAIVNVDKPTLSADEIRQRLTQFEGAGPVLLTRAPRFVEKARLFPGSRFVIGWDTAIRLVAAQYYDNDQKKMIAALEEMQSYDIHFLVAGRNYQGSFRTLDDADLPAAFSSMFEGLPEVLFRSDISSTQLRCD